MHHIDISELEAENTKKSISPVMVYVDNAKNTFYGGYTLFSNYQSSIVNAATAVFHTVLLPVTLTFGAMGKTIIDLATRTAIPDQDIAAIKVKISAFDDLSFDQLVKDITTYQPQSEPSRQLLNQLHHDIMMTATHLKHATEQIEASIKQKVVDECRSRIHPDDIKYLNLSPATNFPFTPSQQKEIDHAVDEELKRYLADIRSKQRELIFEYLDNELNAGKKMEHVIVEKAQQIQKPSFGV